ncbi:MAG: hypothetical protein Q7T82_14050 [Armatimonadota bacterium]|nr:hypothetical protein [Armatimonadota bacterium]
MNFLKDKKNQPIVIGVLVAVILAIGVYFYLVTRQQEPDYTATSDPSASQPTGAVDPSAQGMQPPPTAGARAAPASGVPSPVPGVAGGTPPASGAAQAAAPSAPARPAERHRADPFAMLNQWKPPPRRQVVVREPIPYPTWLIVPLKRTDATGNLPGEAPDTTPRRMAGVLFGQTVSAILETGTETVVVRPGDLVENSTMRVEKIEPNRIVLKSTGGGKARYVVVKMAAGLGAPTSGGADSAPAPTTTTPGSYSQPTTPGSGYRRPLGGGT